MGKKKVGTGCIEGMVCPECGQADCFKIASITMARVYPNGVDDTEDFEWDDRSTVVCPDCGHFGTVTTFSGDPAAPEDPAPEIVEAMQRAVKFLRDPAGSEADRTSIANALDTALFKAKAHGLIPETV